MTDSSKTFYVDITLVFCSTFRQSCVGSKIFSLFQKSSTDSNTRSRRWFKFSVSIASLSSPRRLHHAPHLPRRSTSCHHTASILATLVALILYPRHMNIQSLTSGAPRLSTLWLAVQSSSSTHLRDSSVHLYVAVQVTSRISPPRSSRTSQTTPLTSSFC